MPPGWVTRCQCHLVAAASGSRCHMPWTPRHPWGKSRNLYPRDLWLLSGCPCPHGTHGSNLAVSPWAPWLQAVWVSPWHPRLQPGCVPMGSTVWGSLTNILSSGLCWAARRGRKQGCMREEQIWEPPEMGLLQLPGEGFCNYLDAHPRA